VHHHRDRFCGRQGCDVIYQTMHALCISAGRVLGQRIVVETRVGAFGLLGTKTTTGAKPASTRPNHGRQAAGTPR